MTCDQSRNIWGLLLAVIPGGCHVFPLPLPDLPPEVAVVFENAEQFTVTDDGPLANADAGEAIDALEQIDGCWGAFFIEEGEGDDPLGEVIDSFTGSLTAKVYLVQVFQLEEKTTTAWFLLDLFGVVSELTGGRGSFTISDDNRIVLSYTEKYIESKGGFVPDTSRVTPWLVTLSGDVMRWRHDGEATDDLVGVSVFGNIKDITFARFDCPAEPIQ